ncbi:MAG: O-antigen ligase family protein [Actinobacteria bacterium]|nr:O-antigen ligase family protein [Actinomycetota bacterium]MCG2807301.1 O-antigen ligase family protein [Coriobacteriia bacterium]
MSKLTQPTHVSARFTMPILLALVFLSPGAWLVTRLPPAPIAKALELITPGLWLIALALGLVALRRPHKRLLWGLAALGASVAASYFAGGSHVAVLLYDLYADMPLVQWLMFPLVFALAAGIATDAESVERAMSLVLGLAATIAAIMAFQYLTTSGSGVFGSTAYSVTALVPFVPIGAVLASRAHGVGRLARYSSAGIIALSLAFFSGSLMGALGAGFAALLALAVHPSLCALGQRRERGVRLGLSLTATLAVLAILVAQVPALSGSFVGSNGLAASDRNVLTRVYLWQGAQAMLQDRPILGFGPSGYRTHAVEYLDPEALQFGADRAGNIDPSVYSPQSPHSVLWEIATRLGLLGIAAFCALLVAWLAVIRERLRVPDDSRPLRLALAAGFASALFVLLVNPVVFPIGLFAAASAGLAVGIWDPSGAPRAVNGSRVRLALALSGIVIVTLGIWLGVGEWRGYVAPSDDSYAAAASYEHALAIVPGHPVIERHLMEVRLLTAADEFELQAAQRAVDQAPAHLSEFAPNLVGLATYSLAQAQRTGRTDLSWEQTQLDRAAQTLPPIPSLVCEQLHLAVLSGEPQAVRAALPAAQEWGTPYPYFETYIESATALLGGVN